MDVKSAFNNVSRGHLVERNCKSNQTLSGGQRTL